jgi:hypothetical protein
MPRSTFDGPDCLIGAGGAAIEIKTVPTKDDNCGMKAPISGHIETHASKRLTVKKAGSDP